jgi:NMD protein affecting ribosome stability and mRNA decay
MTNYPFDILNFCAECGCDSIEVHNTLCEDCAALSDPTAKV